MRSRPSGTILTLIVLLALAACSSDPTPPTLEERREAELLYDVARKEAKEGQLYSAVRRLEEALGLDPDRTEVHELMQDLCLRMEKNGDRAAGTMRRSYREQFQKNNDDPQAIYLYARILYQTGRTHDAQRQLERALEVDPDGHCPQIRSALARYYREMEKDTKQADRYDRLARLAVELKKVLAAIATQETSVALHHRYQDLMFAAGRPEPLEPLYRDYHDRHPEDPTFLYLYGRLLAKLGQVKTAQPYFEKALPFAPAQTALAIVTFRTLERKTPLPRAEALAILKKTEAQLTRALKTDPTYRRAHRALTTLLFVRVVQYGDTQGLTACALAIDAGLEAVPDDPELLARKGDLMVYLGAVYLARDVYAQAEQRIDFWRDARRARLAKNQEVISAMTADTLQPPRLFETEEWLLRLGGPSRAIRLQALRAFGQMTKKQDRDRISVGKLLTDPDPEIRLATLDLLDAWKRFVFKETAEGLSAMMRLDPSPKVRARAAQLLGHFADKRVCGYLLIGLNDASPDVRRQVADALTQVSGATIAFDPDGPEAERTEGMQRWLAWWNKQKPVKAPGDTP